MGYINIEFRLKEVIYTIKTLIFLLNIILINLFLLMSFIYLIINKTLAAI